MAYQIDDRCVGCGMCPKICPTAAIAGQPRKRHRVSAAACVDCGACGRICPHGAVQDETGRRCRRIRRRTTNWALPLIDNARCVYCRACIDACPTIAITSIGDKVSVDPYLCQGAGSCVAACPSGIGMMVE